LIFGMGPGEDQGPSFRSVSKNEYLGVTKGGRFERGGTLGHPQPALEPSRRGTKKDRFVLRGDFERAAGTGAHAERAGRGESLGDKKSNPARLVKKEESDKARASKKKVQTRAGFLASGGRRAWGVAKAAQKKNRRVAIRILLDPGRRRSKNTTEG